ncbi:MAG: 2OG-Fe(II) oxygenase, partial [Gammaproteobacteria bacterium]|nr:2OG-Fe(II) oxygenase [Gammaproteobacteria bacterium]
RRFLTPGALAAVRSESEQNRHAAYFCTREHNVYLTPTDPAFVHDHVRNRTVISSKGCITHDQIPQTSPLRTLYDAPEFREFLCAVLDEPSLHAYADPLSSINLHYAEAGQELGWHFDNSSFAVTLMIQQPEQGGEFEYIGGLRDADAGDMGFAAVGRVLDGDIRPQTLAIDAGALVLFRGRNAIHRVTPVVGNRTRILVVLAYNAEPGVSLSESARMTFYGRLQ